MVDITSIRNRIEKKVFTSLGSDASVYTRIEGSTNKWGDYTPTYNLAADIVIVPWNYVLGDEQFKTFGDVEEGDMDIAIRYTQALNIGDVIAFDGVNYITKFVESYNLKNSVLVKVARLVKDIRDITIVTVTTYWVTDQSNNIVTESGNKLIFG